MSKQKQLNIRVDDEFMSAMDDIRSSRRPIPSIADVIRDLVIEKRDAMRRKAEKEGAR